MTIKVLNEMYIIVSLTVNFTLFFVVFFVNMIDLFVIFSVSRCNSCLILRVNLDTIHIKKPVVHVENSVLN